MPEVVDISSDEEEEDLKEGSSNTDFEWIKNTFFNSGDESDGDSDVVFLHENKPPELKSKSLALLVKVVDDDDDDCVVLEDDPENGNGVTSVDDEDATGSDDLVVVGEKGQVACRDYPHARHLCAKFPFSSTPHEKHCGQCHCYVCDSPAPCLKWGAGILSSDHCHANDKTEWKIQRNDFKRILSSPLPASTKYGTSLGMVHSQSSKNLPCDIAHVSQISVLRNQAARSSAMHNPSLNCIPQNQVSRPKATYAHFSLNSSQQNQISRPINSPVSTATNLTIPHGANHGKYLVSRPNLARDRNRPHYVPKQLLSVRNHAIQREQGRGASSLGPQFLRSAMKSKRGLGSMGNTLAANHPSHGLSAFNNHANAVQQPVDFHVTTGFSNPMNLSMFSHSSSGPVSLSRVNPHTRTPEHLYGQSLSQSNNSQNFHQTCIQGNDAPYVGCMNSNQHGNELQNKSLDENAHGNITQSGVTSQDACQPKPQEQSPAITAERFSALDSCWAENISQNTEPLFECSPLQTSGSTNQPSNVEKFSTQFIETVEPVNESSRAPSSFDNFENWPLFKETGPMVTDDVLPFELNVQSPDPSPFDVVEDMLLSPWW